MEKYYYIQTYGCQMNVHESEKIAAILTDLNFQPTQTPETSDVIVFNTCCIRDTAEKKIFGNIGDVKHLKKANPNLIVAVVGCMSQQEGAAEQLKKKYPYIDIILGTNNIEKLSTAIPEREQSKCYFLEVEDSKQFELTEEIAAYRTSGTNAWVNIMYGCDNFCTYCIVPYVRGRERSRAPREILEEIKRLLGTGYREITLLGQNVDSYQHENTRFVHLLEEIAKFEGKFRLRFMTSHPKDFHSGVIDVIKSSPNICNNIHLPVQSGSDRILSLMNRKYTREHYLSLISEIYRGLPNVGITSDIMVGFPTETDADFSDTVSLVNAARFSSAFTFIYSPRRGTEAAKMEQLPYEVKNERIQSLLSVQNEITKEWSASYIGRTEEVLIEDVHPKKSGFLCGRTDSGRLVSFAGAVEEIGTFATVKITEAKSASLWGAR